MTTDSASANTQDSGPDFGDTRDFDDADRGFLGTLEPCVIRDANGEVVWDGDSFSFVTGEAPATVHPSLWRQATLTAKHGIYEVVEGIYQVRGFDLSNITFVESNNGVIVIDPLISTETAAAALKIYREHRGERTVQAVIYSHSHIDHFGGVLGVTSIEDVQSGKVQVIAPEGFMEHAVSENVYAGVAMARRAGYMYGAALPRDPRGTLGAAIGQTTSTGNVGVIPPTTDITHTDQTLTIDGVDIEFQLTPDTEAPAEMHFYFPKFNALCVAENATHSLHNVVTLRGALVRDARAWSSYLTETIDKYVHRSTVLFGSHLWPTWGTERISEFISAQRDIYAYLHDETLRYLNLGYQGAEIAELIELPPVLAKEWSTRGYYGSISHNVKAIYQRYMGWFDANPVNLWPHPPQALAERYVEALGGIDRVVELAQLAFDSGDLRWAATLLGHAVYADESHQHSRELLAKVLEQLGFGSENTTWRNFYLSGALELRDGIFGTPTRSGSTAGLTAHLPPEQILDAIAIAVQAPQVWDLDLAVDLVFGDLAERHRLTLKNGVLIHRRIDPASEPTGATFTFTRTRFLQLLAGDIESPGIEVEGDPTGFQTILLAASTGDPAFPIVTPRRAR